MIEISIYGRGGEGTVTAAQLIAMAVFNEGKSVQAFPAFGVERRGSPVQVFIRIDNKRIFNREQIEKSDFVLIQNSTLVDIIDFNKILKNNAVVMINTTKKMQIKSKSKPKVVCFDALKTAMSHIGKNIVNTTMVALLAKQSKLFKKESLIKAMEERFSGDAFEINKKIVEDVFNEK
jgi:pyruvate ferredoxin oxidoreductase gamma subunit